MKEKQKISINDTNISFYKEGWKYVAEVDNLPEIRAYIENYSWNDNNGYLYCHKLKKYLHRLVVELKIGKDRLDELTKQGFVVDHINNSEPYNCLYDNLHIIHSDINKAKGLTIDKDIEKVRLKAGIGLYCLKDNKYQIAIGFNDPVYYRLKEGHFIDVASAHLTFNDFEICYNAIQIILTWLKQRSGNTIDLLSLQANKIEVEEVKHFQLTKEEEEIGGCIIERDGKLYVKINNKDSNRISLIHKPAKKE